MPLSLDDCIDHKELHRGAAPRVKPKGKATIPIVL
jgi:hypothetical protein